MLESLRPGPHEEEAPLGIAPELVERFVDQVAAKVSKVAASISKAAEARARLLSEGRIGRAGRALDLCYYSVDSSYTAPALELVGGYLGMIFVVGLLYGRNCPVEQGPAVEAYVTYNPTRDLTVLEARRLEREKAMEALRRKDRGETRFDVLLVDGEIIPRLSPGTLSRRDEESRLARRVVDLTDAMVLLSEKTGTPVVGVLKRSYSRDALASLGYFLDVELSDRAFMTYVLEPGEYFVLGTFRELAAAYERLVEDYGEAFRERVAAARSRRAWLRYVLAYSKVAERMRIAFYRPRSGLGGTAVKVEYDASGMSEEELLSSLVTVSESTGFPAPVDYADALSQVPGDFRYTVYQLILERISRESPEVALRLFSLANPQKIVQLGLRT